LRWIAALVELLPASGSRFREATRARHLTSR
jgi:hypothetical protein